MENFRNEARSWLEDHCPQTMRSKGTEEDWVWGGRNATYRHPDAKVWLDRMGAKGWTCPTWPKQYGGGGLSYEENKVLQQELQRIDARRPLMSFGVDMLGPVLLEFGNEAQKLEHLPRIARGEIRWCQGYSEPGAGSDLASLQTRAVEDGNEYVINGSKLWTSFAHFSDWIFCLVRTDFDAPKHEGISFLLFDMTTPGVSVKPIALISGSSQFCETFFVDVRVPRPNLVGVKNDGWKIAKRLLQHERNMVAGMGTGGKSRNSQFTMENQAKTYLGEVDGKVADQVVRDKITRHKMKSRAFSLTISRAAVEAKATSDPSPASSMFKYFGTELNKNRFEIMMDIMGTQALGWEAPCFEDRELQTTREWLRSKANSIEGGTSEVQLNIIAKRVLLLPD
ncbi:MAG: alkylation response protein AidB-like acyl-CoA dehydrogenase [Candidatus Azotimanducaceae bacterium]|jgi:alkylation response protein AidB-like acyl-CoA dehydrogenase